MRKAMIATMLVAAACLVAGIAQAADGDFNETYYQAFHVWNVCDRCVDRCDSPCKPKCAEPCCEPCKPCCPEVCTPPPCPEPPSKCCPAPVCEYPDACAESTGEFDRNGRSRGSA